MDTKKIENDDEIDINKLYNVFQNDIVYKLNFFVR